MNEKCATIREATFEILQDGKPRTLWQLHRAVEDLLGVHVSETAVSAKWRELNQDFGFPVAGTHDTPARIATAQFIRCSEPDAANSRLWWYCLTRTTRVPTEQMELAI
jgi:hypothetical protein